ncbi:MAG: SDR family oxidoreductase [Rhizobium sp.]|nr:SDR family oxidoreductase [Rhizobium sp.]
MEFHGKVALVTGAGSGIGKASAMMLAARGAFVGLLGRTEDELQQVLLAIETAGGEGRVLVADISDETAMRDAVEGLWSAAGRLDMVVANAGINGTWAPIDELRPEEFDQTISVNLRGTYLTLHHAVPKLKKTGGGSIVVVSSINGTRTFTSPGATAYSATKAAQLAMVQQLALELGDDHIRINAVCPGAISTSIDDNTQIRNREDAEVPVHFPEGDIPLTGGTPGEAADVAEVIAFLVSDRARHISGSPIWIDGGQSLLR